AQIRTCGFPAYGSCLGWVTAQVAVYAPAPLTRDPGSESSTCFAGAYSPWPPPFAPPTPLRPPPQTPPQRALFALFAGFIATMTRSVCSRFCIKSFACPLFGCGLVFSYIEFRRLLHVRSATFRFDPVADDLTLCPGRASSPCIAVRRVLPSSERKPTAL